MTSQKGTNAAKKDAIALIVAQPGTRERSVTRGIEGLKNVASYFHLVRHFLDKGGIEVMAGSICDSILETDSCRERIQRLFCEQAACYIFFY